MARHLDGSCTHEVAGVKDTQACAWDVGLSCVCFVPGLLLEINKAICLVLQQFTCHYNSSARRCLPGHLSITHTSGCHNRTRRCWQRCRCGTTLQGHVLSVLEQTEKARHRKHIQCFCLDLTLHKVPRMSQVEEWMQNFIKYIFWTLCVLFFHFFILVQLR